MRGSCVATEDGYFALLSKKTMRGMVVRSSFKRSVRFFLLVWKL